MTSVEMKIASTLYKYGGKYSDRNDGRMDLVGLIGFALLYPGIKQNEYEFFDFCR